MMTIPDTLVQALGWTLVHFLWQGVAVAAVLAIARHLVRSAQVRYMMSIAALVACLLLPIATFVTMVPETIEPPTMATTSMSAYAARPSAQGVATPMPIIVQPMVNLTVGSQPLMSSPTVQQYTPLIVLLWFVGVVLMSARLLHSCWLTRRLRRVGVTPLPPEWAERAQALAKQLGLRRGVQIMTSSIAAVPMAVGVLRPIVLVPVATLLGLTQEQLEAILIHELIHVRRYDGLVVLAERLVETVLFYHPAVWWISSCSRTDREHGCDDAVAARTDARLYAEALASVERLRTPVLAAAATDGSLLTRIRRLVAPASMGTSTRITLPTVIATLALIFLTGAAIGLTAAATAEETMDGDNLPGVVLDGKRVPTLQDLPDLEHGDWSGSMDGKWPFSTIVDAYVAALSYGGEEWSAATVAATFGYPFHFVMKSGAVGHDHNCNIETWHFFSRGSDFGWRTKGASHFTGAGNEPDAEALAAAHEKAWVAVTASIDQGMPAIAWSPSTTNDYAGWGLLVGYDAETKSYHVNHVRTDSLYTIPFDGFGGGWLSVIAFKERTGADLRAAEIETLRRAVEFSKGLLYSVEESQNCCGVDAIGLDAYQLWIDALEDGEFDPVAAQSHAQQLVHTRRLAADYTREAAERFGGAVGARLMQASQHYFQQSEVSRQLLDVVTPWATKAWTPAEAEEARKLVELAREWERGAIMFLEVALLNLGEEIPGATTSPDVAVLQGEPAAKVDVDVAPIQPDYKSTLASSVGPVLHTLGQPGWTAARVQGVLGHLFHFQMAEGGEVVYHDNLDWSLAMDVLQEVATYRTYQTTTDDAEEVRARTVEEARDAVRQSLARGVPALAWNPRSEQQHEDRHPGRGGLCWGLIVGYDEEQQTYTIRHPFVWQGDYTVGYDQIGQWNGNEWFSVMVFDDAKSANDETLHRMALRNAISFADGTRLGEHKWAQGLAALEMWQGAFESADMPHFTHFHARVLTWRKELAAQYMRDLAGIFEEARGPLELAAGHYEHEQKLAQELAQLADVATVHGYSETSLAEARRLLGDVLRHERAAIEQITVALAVVDGS